jgi:hypothetical protein
VINLHKIHIKIEEKTQGVETFRDNGNQVLRFVHPETIRDQAQHLFFFTEKLAKQKSFSPRLVKFLKNQHKDMPHKQ